MDVTDVIGGFGAWQRRIFYVSLYRAIPAAFVIFNVRFFSHDVDFCCVKWIANVTIEEGRCDKYDICDKWRESEKEFSRCALWEFKSSEFGTSIKQEWNLVCHRSWLIALSYVVLTLGSFISYIPAGHLCDKYGRRRLCLIGMTALVVVGVSEIFSPNVEFFLVARFLTGITYGIFQTAAVCLFVESVSPEYRMSMSLAFMGTWGLGIMILPGVSFLLKDWQMLQLVTCALSLVSPLLVWKFVPESPRWLLSVRKDEEAKKIICNAAKLNGVEILDVDRIMQDLKRKVEDEEIAESGATHPSFSDLWHLKTIKRITVILYLTFFTTVFVYHGLISSVEKFPFSLHWMMFAIGLGEAIGSAVFIVEAKYMSRRKSLVRNFFFSGFFVFIARSIESPTSLQVFFSVIGLTLTSMGYTVLWLFTAEIFPTNLRATGISRGICVGRIGSIFGTMMYMEWKYSTWILGFVAILTSALCLLLPNITEKPLPDSVEESNRLPETINRRAVDRTELVSFFRRVFVSRH